MNKLNPIEDNIIEKELVNLEFIDQAVVYGDNKPYLVALIVLNLSLIHI